MPARYEHTGAPVQGYELPRKHPEGVRRRGKPGKERVIASSDQLAPANGSGLIPFLELRCIAIEGASGENEALTGVFHDHIVERGIDGEREVAGQSPWRRGPRYDAGLLSIGKGIAQLERDGKRRILALAIGIVEPGLEVRERSLHRPGIWHDARSTVDETLVMELLEGPDHAFHERDVHRLIVIVEIRPAGLAIDVEPPLSGKSQHGLAAIFVEAGNAVIEDREPP
jgi:hypothetical protein